jgi:hypothetical protein
MASGHVNRTNRPNTWLHRPTCKREEKAFIFLSAFGAKRICRDGGQHIDPTRLTHLRHEWTAFAAMHGPDLL